jgi:hypothetical protein
MKKELYKKCKALNIKNKELLEEMDIILAELKDMENINDRHNLILILETKFIILNSNIKTIHNLMIQIKNLED